MKKMNRRGVLSRLLLTCLVALVFMAGCQQVAQKESASYEGQMAPGGAEADLKMDGLTAQRAAPMESKAYEANQAASPAAIGGGAAPVQTTLKPQLIRRGNIAIEVDELKKALTAVKGLVAANGGYITNQSLTFLDHAGTYRSGQLEVRVPSINFDNFLTQLQAIGKTPGPQITAEDVGKQISDLQATIRNKQKEEEQLLQIMKRSGKVSEVLEVSRELARVRGEIESAQSSLKYYQEQVAYSTVTIQLSEKTVGSPTESKPSLGDALGNSAKKAFDALLGFGLGLMSFLIWTVIYLIPVLAILGVILWLLGKLINGVAVRPVLDRWKKRRALKPDTDQTDASSAEKTAETE